MPEKKVTTSTGKETASQTVARIKAARSAAPATTEKTVNPVMEALTERVIQQGKGISTSSSSNLQDSINEAIAGTREAGRLTSERLESERSRELDFAKDRASATFRRASDSSRGYATQTAAFRELTDTTEKSIRDLDKRYSESIMMNDANTAAQISGLIMQKETFLMQQEQNYYQNLFASAGLQLQQNAQEQSKEEFSANFELQKTKLNLEEDIFVHSKEKDISALAAQFGIVIGEGDTLSDIANKVAPIQSKYLSLQQQNLIGEINARNEQSQSDKALANMQGTVADYIAQGMSPAKAAMQAMKDLSDVGMRTTTENLNAAVTFAEQAKIEYDTITEFNAVESVPTSADLFMDKVGDIFRGAGNLYLGAGERLYEGLQSYDRKYEGSN